MSNKTQTPETGTTEAGSSACNAGLARQQPTFWEVHAEAVNIGERHVPAGRFWTYDEANRARDYLNRTRHPDAPKYHSRKVTFEMEESAEAFIQRREADERQKALSKLTNRERQVLGLAG